MTNKEAIAVLKEKYCGIGSNDLFVFRKAIEALEDVDKYRWHDIIKDHDDLPEEYTPVLVTGVNHNPLSYYSDIAEIIKTLKGYTVFGFQ